MHRNVRRALALLTVLFSMASVASSEDPSESSSFNLEHLDRRDAATVVRTIAGIRQLSIAEEDTIEITGSEVALRLSAELLAALDVPEVEPSRSFTTGDEMVVGVIPLRDISISEAMEALLELRMQRVAAVNEPAAVVVRDTAEKVDLAVATLEKVSGQQNE